MLTFDVLRTEDGGLMLHMIDLEDDEEVRFQFATIDAYEDFIKHLIALGKRAYYNVPIGHG